MGHVLGMDEDRILRQTFLGCTALQIWGRHEEGFDGGTAYRDFLKLPGHIKLIPWPEIRAEAVERALDRQAWREATKNRCSVGL
eukprot:361176-Chlamydomonas_euryale.AAC.1